MRTQGASSLTFAVFNGGQKFKEVAGFDYLALSDPHTNKKYHRVGWVNFVPGTDMAAAEKALAEIKVGPSQNFSLHIARPKESAYSKLRLAPGISNTPERVVKDLDQARKLVALLEAELADTRGTQAIEAKAAEYAATAKAKTGVTGTGGDTKMEDGPEAGAAAKDEGPSTAEIFGKEEAQTDVETDKRVLDLYLYYLRFVFHSCYYCLGVCDFPEELQRRCAKHVRRPLGSVDKSRKNGKPGNEAGWCKNIDERVAMLIEKDKLDPRDHGGENVDECVPLFECIPRERAEPLALAGRRNAYARRSSRMKGLVNSDARAAASCSKRRTSSRSTSSPSMATP